MMGERRVMQEALSTASSCWSIITRPAISNARSRPSTVRLKLSDHGHSAREDLTLAASSPATSTASTSRRSLRRSAAHRPGPTVGSEPAGRNSGVDFSPRRRRYPLPALASTYKHIRNTVVSLGRVHLRGRPRGTANSGGAARGSARSAMRRRSPQREKRGQA
jgi:hypothetical protein